MAPNRRRIELRQGALVQHPTGVYRIAEILDFTTVTASNVESGRTQILAIAELKEPDTTPPATTQEDLHSIVDADWREAQKRYEAIEPLLAAGQLSRQAVEQRGMEVGISPATLYRWIGRYRSLDAVSGLVPFRRGWRYGKGRISIHAEKVIDDVLNNYYLTPEKPSAIKTIRQVLIKCVAKGIPLPSETAIRSRIARLPDYERMKRRGEVEKAKNRYLPKPGTTPDGSYPLEVFQIDHTRIDVIVVDDLHRKPVGRPWLTIAIDQHTRMVAGYFLSFEAPSIASVGMCLAHAILPKEAWLMKHGIEASWPIWGRPKKIRVDNGPDFRSASLRKVCTAYSIDAEFRPVKVPNYGGHIERLQGTLLRELHDLPGTTFSSVEERGEYDSENRAIFTLGELELQLLRIICNEYHRRKHNALDMSPLRRLELSVFGYGSVGGIGMPSRPTDSTTVYVDFLPIFERTVQNDGVEIDGVRYYADVLRAWIKAKDPVTFTSRRHPFRRDPRDISVIWFFDPDIKEYFQIPVADATFPACSLWEYKAAKTELREAGRDPSELDAQIRSINERRSLMQESAARSKSARKTAQRQIENAKLSQSGYPGVHEKPVSDPAASKPSMRKEPQLRPFQDKSLSSSNTLLAIVKREDDVA